LKTRPKLARARVDDFAAFVICRVLLFLVLGAAAIGRAETSSQFRVDADVGNLNFETGEFTSKGHVRIRDKGALLTADEVHGNNRTGVATVSGNVALTRGAVRLLADTMTYKLDGTFSAEHVRLGNYPFYAEGDSATGTATEITIVHARVSYGEPGPWQPTFTADSFTYGPGSQVRSENSLVGIGHLQWLPFPKFKKEMGLPFIPYVSLTGGYRSSLGVFGEAGMHVPVAPGLQLGGDLGVYSSRGVMFGPSGSYSGADNRSAAARLVPIRLYQRSR